MVGQTGYTLTCDVSGAENLNPMIIWIYRNGNTQAQVGNSRTLHLSPLSLSHAGNYSCNVTSTLLNNPVTADNSQSVMIQGEDIANIIISESFSILLSVPIVPDPKSVTVTSSLGTMVLNGSDVTLTCSVQMHQIASSSDHSLLMVNASITKPDGTVLVLSNLVISGTTYKLTTQVNSFDDNDVGNYTCNATVRPKPSAIYLTGMGQSVSNPIKIAIGK